MNLAPFFRIERRTYPIAKQSELVTEGLFYGDRSKPIADNPFSLYSPMQFPCGDVAIPADASRVAEESLELEIGAAAGDHMPISETQTPFVERFETLRVAESNVPRPSGCCNTADLDYRALFGTNGSIQRCKEQFIESRFNPRKAVRLVCREVRVHDFGCKIHGPTDICVVAVSLVSHAA